MKEIVDHIEELEGGSFEGWTPDAVQGYMTACKSIKHFMKELEDKKDVDFIIGEMDEWFGFVLTIDQVEEFLKKHPEAMQMDTVERDDFANYISRKITGMSWPINADSSKYKTTFYNELRANAKKHGYVWNG